MIKRLRIQNYLKYQCVFLLSNSNLNAYDSVYKFFSVLNEKGHQVKEFVMMRDHLHWLINVGTDASTINTLLANGKRFLAYKIIKRLENTMQTNIVKRLEEAVSREEKDKKKKHRVFEVSSDIKPCCYESYLLQKLSYKHSNPVRSKWKLAATPEAYPHSGAAFYKLNVPHPFVKLTHYKKVTFSSALHRPL